MQPSQTQSQFNFIFKACLSALVGLALWLGVTGAFTNGVSIFAGQRSSSLGVEAGHLLACPATPNCVASQEDDSAHKIPALIYLGTSEQAIADLQQILEGFPKVKVISSTDNYLYAEFTSALMGFVDDVEFYVVPPEIQVRSASRLGESDLGVNRKRLESIRANLEQRLTERQQEAGLS
jgi:uncharacterized protein (DUF1499 family)